MRRSDAAIEAWLRTKTKAFLYDGAIKRRILLAPVSTVKDISEDEQLAARDYFRPFFIPGPRGSSPCLAVLSSTATTPPAIVRPAPRLGEHNLEVYVHLLGYSLERVRHLYSTGVI